jgi:Rrf2 family protein
MLSLSSRTHYAALALTHLTSRHDGISLTKSAEIAHSEGIPQSYLEQLMSQLCKSGIVFSHRGAQGGYRLAREPETVTLREVIEAVDGKIRLRPDDGTSLDTVWQMLSQRVADALELTLTELLELSASAEGQEAMHF